MTKRKQMQTALASAEARRLLSDRTGREHAVLAGRGASAIWAALHALGIWDRTVLIPANTCYIVLWAVLQSGNVPALVDIDPRNANISTDTLDRCPAAQPAAVIPAHMYGLPAPMASICAWAKARGAVVIEDAALALGTSADGRPAGAWGDASILSFGDGKIADAGGGGALLTNDAALAAEAERLLPKLPEWTAELARLNRQWLEIYWALHQYEAENPRLPELYPTLFSIYGAITRCHVPAAHWKGLRACLNALDEDFAHRRELARLYDQGLVGDGVRHFERPDDAILWRYPLRVPRQRRDGLLRALWGAGVFEATRWYPSLQAMTHALAPQAPQTDTPEADALAAEIVNLPLTPETTQDEAKRISEIVVNYLNSPLNDDEF